MGERGDWLAEEMSSKLTIGSPVFNTDSNTWLSVQQDIAHERPTKPSFNLGFYCCEKIPWKVIKLERKEFIWLILKDYYLSLKEVRIGTQAPTSIHREMHANTEMWRSGRAGGEGTKWFGQLFDKIGKYTK